MKRIGVLLGLKLGLEIFCTTAALTAAAFVDGREQNVPEGGAATLSGLGWDREV
jgi:hypothetical protein